MALPTTLFGAAGQQILNDLIHGTGKRQAPAWSSAAVVVPDRTRGLRRADRGVDRAGQRHVEILVLLFFLVPIDHDSNGFGRFPGSKGNAA